MKTHKHARTTTRTRSRIRAGYTHAHRHIHAHTKHTQTHMQTYAVLCRSYAAAGTTAAPCCTRHIIHTYMHIPYVGLCISKCMCLHIDMYMHICINMCLYMHIHTFTNSYIYICIYIYKYIYANKYYMYMWGCAFLNACACILICTCT